MGECDRLVEERVEPPESVVSDTYGSSRDSVVTEYKRRSL